MKNYYFAITLSQPDQNGLYPIRGWDTQEAESKLSAQQAVQERASPCGYLAISLPAMTALDWTIEFRVNWELAVKNRDQADQEIVRYTPPPPPPTLAGQQDVLASLATHKKALGVYYRPSSSTDAALFPSDDTAYANALQEAQTVQLGAWTDGTQWTLSDGSSVPMTGADVTALFKKLAAYRAACQNHAAALNEALGHDLNTDLTLGWPDNH